jgi:DNA-binding IclR family transcriptional regulator
VDLQTGLDLPKATLHKLLSTLEERNFLGRDEESGRYGIGLAVFEVGAGGSSPMDIRTLVNPISRNLSREYEKS